MGSFALGPAWQKRSGPFMGQGVMRFKEPTPFSGEGGERGEGGARIRPFLGGLATPSVCGGSSAWGGEAAYGGWGTDSGIREGAVEADAGPKAAPPGPATSEGVRRGS